MKITIDDKVIHELKNSEHLYELAPDPLLQLAFRISLEFRECLPRKIISKAEMIKTVFLEEKYPAPLITNQHVTILNMQFHVTLVTVFRGERLERVMRWDRHAHKFCLGRVENAQFVCEEDVMIKNICQPEKWEKPEIIARVLTYGVKKKLVLLRSKIQLDKDAVAELINAFSQSILFDTK